MGLMGNAEQGTITNVAFASGNTMVVTIQNTGQSLMNFTSAYVNGAVATSTQHLAPKELQKAHLRPTVYVATYAKRH